MPTVMQAIKKRKGLCPEIARRLGIPRQNVHAWIIVPKKHIKTVSEITGLPEKIIRAEHEERWRIPVKELAG